MQKILIFGNSGSGKSTLSKRLTQENGFKYLDLDILAWTETTGSELPERRALSESVELINQFIEKNKSWVVEGCYADLLAHLLESADEVIFLNPGVETCLNNCRNRPWEPHKYASIEEQNKNLDMLLEWVKRYPERDDEFSLSAHRKLFEKFSGKKDEYNANLN